MADLITDPSAHLHTREAQDAIQAARAENAAKARDALISALGRYADRLLPGSPARIAECHPELAVGDAGTRAARLHQFLASDAARPYKRVELTPPPGPVVQFRATPGGALIPEAPTPAPAPEEPRRDALRVAVDLFKAAFSAGQAERFYEAFALDYSHRDEAEAIAFVAGAVESRAFNAYLKSPIPPGERTMRVVAILQGYRGQLKGDLTELAESRFADLADPLKPAMRQPDLERAVVRRLETLPADRFLDGTFDPADYKGERWRPSVESAPAPGGPPPFQW